MLSGHLFLTERLDVLLRPGRIGCRICGGKAQSVVPSHSSRAADLTVVGDDAQSIYSFRAATVRNILDFPSQFEPSARIITLEQRITGPPSPSSMPAIA